MSLDLSRNRRRAGNRVSRNAAIAFRAERIVARRRLAVVQKQSGMFAFAGFVAGIGIIMLNVGAFFGLSEPLGHAAAATIVAAVNLALAGLLAFHASGISAERELEPVIEVRDLALEDIEAEVGDALGEARDLVENVRRMARHPLGASAPEIIGPALTLLLGILKKK